MSQPPYIPPAMADWFSTLLKWRNTSNHYKESTSHIRMSAFNTIRGRIVSFLEKKPQINLAQTCKGSYQASVAEKKRQLQSVVECIQDNFVILDTNTTALVSLEDAVKKGAVILLCSMHLKLSHDRFHETFMKVAANAETRIFTEIQPKAFTNDPYLLAKMEGWGFFHLNEDIPRGKILYASSVPSQLQRVMEETRLSFSVLSVGLTLFFMHLIKVKTAQQFFQNIFFFQSFYDIAPLKVALADYALVANGTHEVVHFRELKLYWLSTLVDVIRAFQSRMFERECIEMRRAKVYTKRNEDLLHKIESAWATHHSVVASAGCLHFFNMIDMNPFFGMSKFQLDDEPITKKLSSKNIPYIALFPKEKLFPNSLIESTSNLTAYRKWMQWYVQADRMVTFWDIYEKGEKKWEAEAPFLSHFSKEELIQEFENSFTKSAQELHGFPWEKACWIVCKYLLDNYQKSASKKI